MRYFVPLLLIALCLTGCMPSPEQRLIGKWKGTMEVSDALKAMPFGSEATGIANLTDPQLDLKPDKTFKLFLAFAPMEGTWTYANGEVTLKPSKMFGMSSNDVKERTKGMVGRVNSNLPFPLPSSEVPMAEEMHVKVLNDFESLTLDPGTGTFVGGFGKMTFKKV